MEQLEIERAILWNSLTTLGSVIKTNLIFPGHTVLSKLEEFNDKWVPYNQYKDSLTNNRWGLPITSIDGSVNSTEHLNSFEYMEKYHDSKLDESKFTVPTEVCNAIPEIGNIVNIFAPDIGRVHFLKIGNGGYFPPHRDFPGYSPEWVRLIAVFGKTSPTHYAHILDGNLTYLQPGAFYFVNFQLEHSMFSFTDSVYAVILTINLNQRTHDLVLKHIE